MSGPGNPYRTSAKVASKVKTDKIRFFKKNLPHVEVCFYFKDLPSISHTFKGDGMPDPIFLKEKHMFESSLDMKDGEYYLRSMFKKSFDGGFLTLGDKYIPWHCLLEATIINRIDNIIEFEWFEE